MEKEQLVERLVGILANNLRSVQNQVNDFAKDYFVQRALLRGLMNMHAVNKTLPEEYFKLQDELLQQELKEKKLDLDVIMETCGLTPLSKVNKTNNINKCFKRKYRGHSDMLDQLIVDLI